MKNIFDEISFMKTYWEDLLDRVVDEDMREVFEDFSYDDDDEELYDSIEDHWASRSNSFPDLTLAHGAFRMVIADRKTRSAIKFQAFGVSKYGDQCALEENTYKEAIAEGWGEMFCPISFLMTYEVSPSIAFNVYLCPYIDCDEDDNCDLVDSLTDNLQADFFEYEENILTAALMTHNREKEKNEFVTFLNNWFCNDLHIGNWGMDDDKMIIVDYAGVGRVVE